jgi:cytochrome c peroxidase
MKRIGFLLLVLCAPALAAPFTDDEARKIQSHGPWPAPWSPDPSNRVSGNKNAIDLGERLFERRLPVTARSPLRCRSPATGAAAAARGSQVDSAAGVVNVRYLRWFGWDGCDSLWASINPDWMRSAGGRGEIRPGGRDRLPLRKTFGTAGADDENLVDAAKALAAFRRRW